MSVPKKHHYVPKAYLQQWEDNEKLLWVYDLSTSTFSHKSKGSVLTEDYLYSITLREFNLLSRQQKEFFAEPLNDYQVFLDGNQLDKAGIIENLVRYDDFIIRKKDGLKVKAKHKESLLDAVFNQRHPLIEKLFGPIETSWPATVEFFEDWHHAIISGQKSRFDANAIKLYSDRLLNFILATYTRNPINILHSLNRIEEKTESSIEAETRRYVFERIQLEYLTDGRKMFNTYEYDIHLIFAASGYFFLTTDNPVVVRHVHIEDVDFTGVIWFPISPNCLVSLSKKTVDAIKSQEKTVFTYVVAGESINTFNQYICENANRIIISSRKISDIRFTFSCN